MLLAGHLTRGDASASPGAFLGISLWLLWGCLWRIFRGRRPAPCVVPGWRADGWGSCGGGESTSAGPFQDLGPCFTLGCLRGRLIWAWARWVLGGWQAEQLQQLQVEQLQQLQLEQLQLEQLQQLQLEQLQLA